jgi:hypothetical protein
METFSIIGEFASKEGEGKARKKTNINREALNRFFTIANIKLWS